MGFHSHPWSSFKNVFIPNKKVCSTLLNQNLFFANKWIIQSSKQYLTFPDKVELYEHEHMNIFHARLQCLGCLIWTGNCQLGIHTQNKPFVNVTNNKVDTCPDSQQLHFPYSLKWHKKGTVYYCKGDISSFFWKRICFRRSTFLILKPLILLSYLVASYFV